LGTRISAVQILDTCPGQNLVNRPFQVTVKIPRDMLKTTSTDIAFSLEEGTDGKKAVYDSVFLAPEQMR
jgi:hypothetical protein